MRLIATKRLRYPRNLESRMLEPGDEFEPVNDRDARVLTAARLARPASSSSSAGTPIAAAGQAEGSGDPTPRGKYKRRDMRADD